MFPSTSAMKVSITAARLNDSSAGNLMFTVF